MDDPSCSGCSYRIFKVSSTPTIVHGIQDVTCRNDYAVILCNSDEKPNTEKFHLDILKSISVDSVVLLPIQQNGKVIEEFIKPRITIICVDRKLSRESVNTVVIDNHKGAHLAVSHLIEMSHREIAIILNSSQLPSFLERQEDYEHQLSHDRAYIHGNHGADSEIPGVGLPIDSKQ